MPGLPHSGWSWVRLCDALGVAFGTSGNPVYVEGALSISPATSSTANTPAQTTVGATSSKILSANASAKGRRIENSSVRQIYLGFGAAPTVTAYHKALSACGTHDDGAGGVWNGIGEDGLLFQGDVYAIASGAGGTVVITEFT